MAVELSTLMLKVDSAAAQKSLKDFGSAANATGVEGTRMGKAYEEAAKNLIDSADRVEAKYKSQIDVMRGAAKEQLDLLKAMQDAEKQGDKNVAKLQAQEKSQQAIIDALRKSTATMSEVEKAEAELLSTKNKLNTAMSEQKTRQEATAEANKIYSDCLSEHAKISAEMNNEMRETVDLFNQGRQVITESQTPLESYNMRVRELEQMVKSGAIGQQEFTSETEKAKLAMDNAERSTSSLADNSKKLFAALGIGVAAMKAYQMALRGVQTAQTNIIASSRLDGVLRATGEAAGFSRAELSELGEELRLNSTHASTSIDNMMSLMLTFREISGDVLPRAISAVGDMAGVMGSLDSAAMAVGKALNSPAEGLSALSRVGIRFNDEQKAMIETMIATGDAAGAQAVILEELEKRFGGVSKAILDTPAGKLQQLRAEYSDLEAELASKLLPALVSFQQTMNNLTKFLTDNLDYAIIAAATGFTLMIPPIVAVTKATIAKTAAVVGLTKAMAFNPLFVKAALVAAGIGMAVVAINRFTQANREAADSIVNSGDILMKQREEIVRFFETVENRIKKADSILQAHNENMMTDTERALARITEAYDSTIKDIQSRLEAFDAGIEIPVVFQMEAGGDWVNERDALEERLTSIVEASSRERSQVMANAGRADRENRAAILRQIELDLMDSTDREFSILAATYNERKKLFRENSEERRQLDFWYSQQKADIEAKIAADELATGNARLAREQVFIDRLKTELERRVDDHRAAMMEIDEAESEGVVNTERAARLRKMAINEQIDGLEDLRMAHVREKKELLGIEQTAREALEAGYADRLKALERALRQEIISREEAAEATLRIEAQKVQALAEYDQRIVDQSDIARIRLLDQLMDEETAIEVSYRRRVDEIDRALQSGLIKEHEYHALRVKYAKEAANLIIATHAATAKAVASALSGMTDLMSATFGEQFGLTQAFAIATAKVNVAAAIASALATQPFIPAGLAAWGTALSATAGLVSNIKQTQFSGERDRGGTIRDGEFVLAAERRPEFINGALLTEPAFVRGPARITSGAETERMLSGNVKANNGDGNHTTVQETTYLTVNVSDVGGNITSQFRDAVRTGEVLPVIKEALQAVGG